jgi:8-oxo-dGTP pyrophosphatase MutT (NUDIX family)
VYITGQVLSEAEAKFGIPRELDLEFEIDDSELNLIRKSRKNQRSHDVTLFMFHSTGADSFKAEGHRYIAAIRKPGFPPGAYRAPSGGVMPGESVEAGAKREAFEETGLNVELERYVLRVKATFTCGEAVEKWVTHIFTARIVGGHLNPLDTQEIEHARCVSLDELQGPIKQILLESGRALFAYRVALTDATINILREKGD